MNLLYILLPIAIIILIIGVALSIRFKSLVAIIPIIIGIIALAISCYFVSATMWSDFSYAFFGIGIILLIIGIALAIIPSFSSSKS